MIEKKRTILPTVILVGLLLLVTSGLVQADQHKIVWSTIDGGGGTSTGGTYQLEGTIGQPDAAYSYGGDCEVLGGFWPGGPLCFVEFEDFARFAEHWLQTGCNEANDWCGGADLNHLEGVNWTDLDWFTDDWLLRCPYNWPLK